MGKEPNPIGVLLSLNDDFLQTTKQFWVFIPPLLEEFLGSRIGVP
jgi:hypothetical protein